MIAGLEAAVRQAQHDLDDTVLRAPVDGTVSALNGAVGEYVAASSGTSALAPGSAAAIPGTGGVSAAAATSAVARPGGTQFLVLDGVDTFYGDLRVMPRSGPLGLVAGPSGVRRSA